MLILGYKIKRRADYTSARAEIDLRRVYVCDPKRFPTWRASLYHEVGHVATWGQFEAQRSKIECALKARCVSRLLLETEAAAWRWAAAEYERRHGGLDDEFIAEMKQSYGTYVKGRAKYLELYPWIDFSWSF